MWGANIILVGEAGSGKTEIAVNLAMRLVREEGRRLILVDLDQTKSLFRARDLAAFLKDKQVNLARNLELWDSPVMPEGVSTYLADEGLTCLVDAGGNVMGATMLGQFAGILARTRSQYFFVINPCRAFSGTPADIGDTLQAILRSARIPKGRLQAIINPYLGEYTTPELIVEYGSSCRQTLLEMGFETAFLAVSTAFAPQVREKCSLPLFPLEPYVNRLYV